MASHSLRSNIKVSDNYARAAKKKKSSPTTSFSFEKLKKFLSGQLSEIKVHKNLSNDHFSAHSTVAMRSENCEILCSFLSRPFDACYLVAGFSLRCVECYPDGANKCALLSRLLFVPRHRSPSPFLAGLGSKLNKTNVKENRSQACSG